MIPEELQVFVKINTRDYNKVNIPFRFKNDLSRGIQCIPLNRGS